MPRGGYRPGAGRKGGSTAGQVQKLRTVARARIAELVQNGRDPLDAVLDVAFDADQPVTVRLQAAIAALPFVHPKLSMQAIESTSIQAKIDGPRVLDELMNRLSRLAPPAPTLDGVAEPAPRPGGGGVR